MKYTYFKEHLIIYNSCLKDIKREVINTPANFLAKIILLSIITVIFLIYSILLFLNPSLNGKALMFA